MKKYWIIVEGQPIGPFTTSELKMRKDFSADLPVWYNELPDWTTVGALPELACLLEVTEVEPLEAEKPQPTAKLEDLFATKEEPQQTGWVPQSAMQAVVEAEQGEKRPKSFIGWNVAMLLCCCMPGGIIGLIFGSQVNNKWERGDIEGAKKSSEIAEWCVIISIVLGLISWPFQLMFI